MKRSETGAKSAFGVGSRERPICNRTVGPGRYFPNPRAVERYVKNRFNFRSHSLLLLGTSAKRINYRRSQSECHQHVPDRGPQP